MPQLENTNPTIRNASDLPTRRRRRSSSAAKQTVPGLFAASIPSSTYLSDPFALASSSDSDSDDDAVEPIDEQEVYGTIPILNVIDYARY